MENMAASKKSKASKVAKEGEAGTSAKVSHQAPKVRICPKPKRKRLTCNQNLAKPQVREELYVPIYRDWPQTSSIQDAERKYQAKAAEDHEAQGSNPLERWEKETVQKSAWNGVGSFKPLHGGHDTAGGIPDSNMGDCWSIEGNNGRM